ncbi:hypothetical protein DUNSADRAFT_1573 [Dunaliella salina]|uniref:Encoded protein n=1 Tax=Dunaliella salina TaxID=3046 RepID=A0ABQ7H8G3_DUNSA|nr:hypothetical protein DUNSADRAFT_1573 [Dunaliella salina]|eukprot:KAF5843146.1 hypothetical protein DUNSADRAFT_1573 [Dunaliella salina]
MVGHKDRFCWTEQGPADGQKLSWALLRATATEEDATLVGDQGQAWGCIPPSPHARPHTYSIFKHMSCSMTHLWKFVLAAAVADATGRGCYPRTNSAPAVLLLQAAYALQCDLPEGICPRCCCCCCCCCCCYWRRVLSQAYLWPPTTAACLPWQLLRAHIEGDSGHTGQPPTTAARLRWQLLRGAPCSCTHLGHIRHTGLPPTSVAYLPWRQPCNTPCRWSIFEH